MKAAQIVKYGGKEVLKLNDNVSKPKPSSGQVLVEVYAAATNPFDVKVREGLTKNYIKLKLPATLGGDVAGKIAELGEGVKGFKIGQAVYGMANAAGGQGSYAEFTAVKVEQLADKPRSIDFNTAAALPLAGVSAYQALVSHMQLRSGQKILVHGGAGGIGSIAIQIAKELGVHIATTIRAADMEYVKQLGANEIINYETQDFSTLIKDYDAVFDTVGGETNKKSYKVLKTGGILVSMAAQVDEGLVNQYSIRYLHQSTKVTNERLKKLANLVDAGKLKINVDQVFPLNKADEALEYQKTGHPKGKVVIQVKT
ncbi:MAG TPA: NADP-dependent oxidoreductase [Candidatus Saccharimonadales bacterium]|nr:NADP-dependent oxidoreductase [Candidatus Saccharimonadales bacterium]